MNKRLREDLLGFGLSAFLFGFLVLVNVLM